MNASIRETIDIFAEIDCHPTHRTGSRKRIQRRRKFRKAMEEAARVKAQFLDLPFELVELVARELSLPSLVALQFTCRKFCIWMPAMRL
jgi:hypothetical protein